MKLNSITKKIIAVISIVYAVYFFWFGSVLMIRKAIIFSKTITIVSSGVTFTDFIFNFNKLLGSFSPIGQSESVAEFGNTMVNVLSSSDQLPEEVVDNLLKYTDKYLGAAVQEKSGHISKNLLISGKIYYIAGFKYRNEDWLNKAEVYLRQGLEASPNRPEFLYTLLNFYIEKKALNSANVVSKKILNLWPDDTRIKSLMEGGFKTYEK